LLTPVSVAPTPSAAALVEDGAVPPSSAELEDRVPSDASSDYVDAFVDCRGGNFLRRAVAETHPALARHGAAGQDFFEKFFENFSPAPFVSILEGAGAVVIKTTSG
jgi:hypothetical protein